MARPAAACPRTSPPPRSPGAPSPRAAGRSLTWPRLRFRSGNSSPGAFRGGPGNRAQAASPSRGQSHGPLWLGCSRAPHSWRCRPPGAAALTPPGSSSGAVCALPSIPAGPPGAPPSLVPGAPACLGLGARPARLLPPLRWQLRRPPSPDWPWERLVPAAEGGVTDPLGPQARDVPSPTLTPKIALLKKMRGI